MLNKIEKEKSRFVISEPDKKVGFKTAVAIYSITILIGIVCSFFTTSY